MVRFWKNRGPERRQILWLLAPWVMLLPAILIDKFLPQEWSQGQASVPAWVSTTVGLVVAAAMADGMAIGVLKYPPAEGAGEERALDSGGAGELMGIEGASESAAPISMRSWRARMPLDRNRGRYAEPARSP